MSNQNTTLAFMKQLLFISIMCTLMCASSSVSKANGSQPKAGIEKVDFSPPTITLGVIENYNISVCENHCNTGSPAQTLIACDKAITAPAAKGNASLVDRNLWRSGKFDSYNSDNKSSTSYAANSFNPKEFYRGATPRRARDGLRHA